MVSQCKYSKINRQPADFGATASVKEKHYMALKIKIPWALFSDVTMLMEKLVLRWAQDINTSPGSTLLGDIRDGLHLNQCGDAAARMENTI